MHSATEFERLFERERALCDRSLDYLGLVVFHPSRRSDLPALVAVLNERTRVSDVLGYLDSDRIAVILPQTGPSGAPIFIEHLLPMLAARGVRCTYDLYVYPESPPVERSDRRRAESANGHSHVGGASTNGASTNGASTNGASTNGASANGASTNGGDATGRYTDPDCTHRECTNGAGADEESSDRERRKGGREASESEAAPTHRPTSLLGRVRSTRATPAELAPHLLTPLPVWKRLLDIAVSAALLVLLSPLFLLVAIAIKLTSRGPVIYRQLRAGQGGVPFPFYKFRSMYVDADRRRAELEEANEADGPVFKIRNDPRITPIGSLLRRTSIDELPQLWSVLNGDMTLVGPRPPLLDEVAKYEPWQRQRLSVKGGLTCIWQVSGRSEIGFQDWVRMDVRYTRQRSMRLDLSLLRRTARAVLSRRGAY